MINLIWEDEWQGSWGWLIDFSLTILCEWCCRELEKIQKAYHTLCMCVHACTRVCTSVGITLIYTFICYIGRNVLKVVRKLRKIWTGDLGISHWVITHKGWGLNQGDWQHLMGKWRKGESKKGTRRIKNGRNRIGKSDLTGARGWLYFKKVVATCVIYFG